MRYRLLTLFTALVILLYSCKRENFNQPKTQSDQILKRTITTDSAGRIIRAIYYNDKELPVTDTSFNSSGATVGVTLNEYNSKGKLTRWQLIVPAVYSPGYLWADESVYLDDTVLILSRHYLKGNQTALTKHFYNASGQLILDSVYHTGYTVSTDTKKCGYDAQGRLLTDVRFNNLADTIQYISYQYSTDYVEQFTTSYNYSPLILTYSKIVTDYTSTGNILSQKEYAPPTLLNSQSDYTYDANGHLLKKITTTASGIAEERYFNNATSGKPERMEYYYLNQLRSVKTYYYE